MSLRQRLIAAGHVGLPFDAFMEAALYDDREGFYTRQQRAGAEFVTSPTLTPAFGHVLAGVVVRLLDNLPQPLAIVELGAATGELAGDVAARIAVEREEMARAATFILVERGYGLDKAVAAVRSHWPGRVIGVRTLEELPPITGVVYGNEILDALPARLGVIRDGKARERMVITRDKRLALEERAPADELLDHWVRWLGIEPAEGQGFEVLTGLRLFVGALAARIHRGYAIFVDYGGTAEEVLDARANPHGTLHGYHEGLRVPIEMTVGNPGSVDITYLVNFSALHRLLGEAGLYPLAYTTQGAFLERFGILDLPLDAEGMLAVKKLVHPDGAGGTFKVSLAATMGLPRPRRWPAGNAPL